MEEWKFIDGFTNYMVSNLGRVKSLKVMKKLRKGSIKETILKQNIIKGYHNVTLYRGDDRINARVNRLVAIAFIPNDENKLQVNHKKGIKSDNRASELEWNTCSENAQHAYNIGLRIAPEYKGTLDKPVLAVKDLSVIEFKSRRHCAKELSIPFGSIGRLIDSGKERDGYYLYSA